MLQSRPERCAGEAFASACSSILERLPGVPPQVRDHRSPLDGVGIVQAGQEVPRFCDPPLVQEDIREEPGPRRLVAFIERTPEGFFGLPGATRPEQGLRPDQEITLACCRQGICGPAGPQEALGSHGSHRFGQETGLPGGGSLAEGSLQPEFRGVEQAPRAGPPYAEPCAWGRTTTVLSNRRQPSRRGDPRRARGLPRAGPGCRPTDRAPRPAWAIPTSRWR